MKHSTNLRRLAALLAVPTLLLTAACGSDSDDGGKDGVAKVSGKFGAKPSVTIPKGTDPAEKTVTKTVSSGSGAAVAKGDFVRLDFAAKSWKDGKDLGSTWQQTPGAGTGAARQQVVEQTGQQSQLLPAKVLNAVVGKKSGSRLLVQGTAKDLIGENLNPQSGLKPEDTLVWVVDVIGGAKVDSKAEAKGTQAKVASGLPEVKANGQKAATITIPKGEKAPKDLKDQVLIQGNGKKVEAGEGLIAQYTGVGWEDGKKFDSSWDHGGATAFQIGTGSVVQGWDKSLVGKKVGDRVLLVVPPKLGYAADASNPLAKKTLVFSVDILGTV